MDYKSGLGHAVLPGLGLGAATKEWNSLAWGTESGLMCKSRRRGWGLRPMQTDPRPHWGAQPPDSGEVAGVDPAGLGPLGRARCPRREGSEQPGARRVPHPARPHSARAPQSTPGAAGHACRSCHRLHPCKSRRRRRRRRPDPLAPPLPGSPAAGQSRPCRPSPTRASCRRLSPAPPPTQLGWKGRVGEGGRLPPPHSHPLGSPLPPPPARARACWDVESSSC